MTAPGNRRAPHGDGWGVQHEEFRDLASASVDDEVSDDERRRLDRHLGDCADCRRFVRAAHDLRRRIRVAPVAPAVASGPDADGGVAVDVDQLRGARLDVRRTRRNRRLAGTLTAVAGLLAVLALAFGPTDDVPPETATAPTAGSTASGAIDLAGVPGASVVRLGADDFDHSEVDLSVDGVLEIANGSSNRHLLVERSGTTITNEDFAPGESRGLRFTEAGVYELRCRIHEDMAMTVRVHA